MPIIPDTGIMIKRWMGGPSYGEEAAHFDGHIYFGQGSHFGALNSIAQKLNLLKENELWATPEYDKFYARLYPDGDLYLKIKHGWYEEKYQQFIWNYHFGE